LGYVSVFAPDPHFDPSARSLIRQYNRYSKNKAFGAFGPATYMAGLVAMNAIENACDDGTTNRAEVTRQVRRTNIPSIFGGRIRFSAKGDPLPTKFVIYKVTNGKYSPAA
jgi:ABC-type branched-subunit amino acid transport system substrate-binding protein